MTRLGALRVGLILLLGLLVCAKLLVDNQAEDLKQREAALAEQAKKVETMALQANKKAYHEKLLADNASNFSDNQDGTVTLKNSGLMWQRCAIGQVWTGRACEGDAEKFTWYGAMKLNSHFAGHDNWRLPTQEELMVLVFCVGGEPAGTLSTPCTNDDTIALNTLYFSNTQSRWFWSSSPYVHNNHYAWYVDFNRGYANYNDKNAYANVRLVR